MAFTKLNADAPPFHPSRSSSTRLHLCTPPPPPSFTATAHHDAAGFPLPLPFSPNNHRYPLPPPPPSPFLCDGGFRWPRLAPSLRKQEERRPSPAFSRGAFVVGRLYGKALAKARALQAAPARRRRGPAPAAQAQPCGPRALRKQAAVARGAWPARSPAFTMRPTTLPPRPPPEWLGCVSTVMIRNIPSRLTRAGMMELLDDHCASENGRGAAYDFLYLPMDFSMCSRQRSSNKGYAFVNLTTAEAAAGLYHALHGCRWDPSFRSDKIIHVDAARIQGKERLARRFSGSTFACHTDEYLPAVFSPPRGGGGGGGAGRHPFASKPRPVGLRVPPRAAAAVQRNGKKAARGGSQVK